MRSHKLRRAHPLPLSLGRLSLTARNQSLTHQPAIRPTSNPTNRPQQPGFIEPSFPTIAGADSNGAVIHYRAKEETARWAAGLEQRLQQIVQLLTPAQAQMRRTPPPLTPHPPTPPKPHPPPQTPPTQTPPTHPPTHRSFAPRTVSGSTLLLLDSGGQYDCGTTDITRTVHLGTPDDYQRRCYTRVLQGHIGLDRVRGEVDSALGWCINCGRLRVIWLAVWA